jgi:hypothetical protein
LSEAAVYTISVLVDGAYVGTGVTVTEDEVVVKGMAVVGAGFETTVVVVGWTGTVVAAVTVVGCGVVVVQPAKNAAIIRSAQTILIAVNRYT